MGGFVGGWRMCKTRSSLRSLYKIHVVSKISIFDIGLEHKGS